MNSVFEYRYCIGPNFLLFDENLHHGRFLFRHKGKKKRGKPNYPPTKLVVKTGRKNQRADRGQRKRNKPDARLARSLYSDALKVHNKERRCRRALERTLHSEGNVIFVPKGMFRSGK